VAIAGGGLLLLGAIVALVVFIVVRKKRKLDGSGLPYRQKRASTWMKASDTVATAYLHQLFFSSLVVFTIYPFLMEVDVVSYFIVSSDVAQVATAQALYSVNQFPTQLEAREIEMEVTRQQRRGY
jgi:hypothetical protein